MVVKRTIPEYIFDIINYILLSLVILITIYPFWHSVMASISDSAQIMSHKGPILIPLGFSLASYRMVFENPNILTGYYNTVINLLIGTAINIVLTSFAAYALSRKGLYWKNAITFFIIFTMFFSGGLIPLYLTVSKLGLLDSRFSVLFPLALNTWNLIVMRTYFATIPDSMEESATIDGANDFIILFRIIIPLSIPILAVMILFYGVAHWNAWFYAMLFIRKRALYPLQLILREILITNSTDSMVTGVQSADKEQVSESIKYSTIIVATLPILMVYPFLQKYFVKGIMIGAVKE